MTENFERFGVSDPVGSWQAENYITNAANTRAVIYDNLTGYESPSGLQLLFFRLRTGGVRLR